MNVYVLYGGRSIEHEVSVISATAVLNAIDKKKHKVYPVFISKDGKWCPFGLLNKNIEDSQELELTSDLSIAQSMASFLESIDQDQENIVFPVLHGNNGEDGTIQGLLELLDLAYVGNEVLASSICMDKVTMSEILDAHNIPQANYTTLRNYQWEGNMESSLEKILDQVKLPVFVKPANSGSSVGISRAATREELIKSIELAFIYDVRLLIQEEVIGREVETCIIGNNNPKASLPGELLMENAFYDYEAKYITKKAQPLIPAKLSLDCQERLRDYALKTYEVLDCRGIARVDIFVTEDEKILVNEVNTMPGFTSISMAPMLWKATDGTEFSDLVNQLLDYGLERHKEKESISKVKVTE